MSIALDGLGPTDHLIVDELCVATMEKLYSDLSEIIRLVKSIWIGCGSIDGRIKEEVLLDGCRQIQTLGFLVPTMNICLRNTKAITGFAMNNEDYSEVAYQEVLSKSVITSTNVNAGLFLERCWMEHQLEDAVKWSLQMAPNPQKSFIGMVFFFFLQAI